MTLYTTSIGNNQHQIEITNQNVMINGRYLKAELVELSEDGLFLLIKGFEKRELIIKPLGRGQYSMNVYGKHAEVHVKKTHARVKGVSEESPETEVKAPIAGVVVKATAKIGETVKKDDVLLVMESMKMHMSIRAATDGVVKDIFVKSGSLVNKGDRLIEIE